MGYVKENINPKGLKNGDCVVRALAKVTGRGWYDIYEELYLIGKREATMPNDKHTYKMFIETLNTEKVNVFKDVNGKRKRLTVNDVSKLEGKHIVTTAHHLTATMDGNYYDIWDCGKKCAYMIWKVN